MTKTKATEDRIRQLESEISKVMKEFLRMGDEIFSGNNDEEFLKETTKKGRELNKLMKENLKLMRKQLKNES